LRSNFARVKKLLSKHGLYKRIQFNHRNPILRSLEGSYSISSYWGDDEELLNSAQTLWDDKTRYTKYIPSGSKLSKSLQNLRFSLDRIAKFLENLGERRLIFSCKASDIARMSMSKHFTTCKNLSAGCFKDDIPQHCADPNLAIIFVPDRGGQMMSRCLVKLLKDKNGEDVLGLFRAYGNGILSHQMIQEPLKSKIKVFTLCGEGQESLFEFREVELRIDYEDSSIKRDPYNKRMFVYTAKKILQLTTIS